MAYLDRVFSHSVVVQPSLGPELFVALLALQGVLELKGWMTSHKEEKSNTGIHGPGYIL